MWRLDRLGRNLADWVRIVNELEARLVGFESIMENIETTSPSGKRVFHLFVALAEFERNVLREQTLAGLRAARGRKGGRPKKLACQSCIDTDRRSFFEGEILRAGALRAPAGSLPKTTYELPLTLSATAAVR